MYFKFQMLFMILLFFNLYCENFESSDSSQFSAPTLKFLENRREDYLKDVFEENERLIPLKGLLDEAISCEQLGFFGYHGCCSDFRIFQDLIRIGIEEILEIPIKKDFHFLRIPGDKLYTYNTPAEIFENYQDDIDDLREDESAQLLSLQLAMYRGCAPDNGNCSIGFLAYNYSMNTIDYAKQLERFFDCLGIDVNQAANAFEIGKKMLPRENGSLLQFFDMSHAHTNGIPYHFADQFAYPAHEGGMPIDKENVVSNYIREGKKFPQIRLVISNRNVLNPNSPLTIKRYENIDPKTIDQYEEALRTFYRMQTVNLKKKAHYQSLLMSLWSLSDNVHVNL